MKQTTIRFACPGCRRQLKVSQTLAGKVGVCPGCKKKLRIPQVSRTSAHRSEAPTAEKPPQPQTASSPLDGWDDLPPAIDPPHAVTMFPGVAPASLGGTPGHAVASRPKIDLDKAIAEQFTQPMPRQRVASGYRFAMTVIAIYMMALPLMYVGLIALASWGVYHYTFSVFPNALSVPVRGRGAALMFLVLTLPIVAGISVVLFMTKPIFVTLFQGSSQRKRSLNRHYQSRVFELVDRLCDTTGAPRPAKINIDCDANASASLSSSVFSFFRPQLELTIGLPLVSDFTLRQLTGVLAHEFGHFSQGAAMRASGIIRQVSYWLVHAVYARDVIDETLDEWIEDSESWLILPLFVAKFFGGITRMILWVFMIAGELGSSFLQRQMEFDADRYESYIAGSKTFRETSEAFQLVGASHQQTEMLLLNLFKQGIMIDDIPRITQLIRYRMPPEIKKSILKNANDSTTGLFDSHPCDSERIAASERLDCEGVFTIDCPARDLFQDFPALCRGVTEDFYRNRLGTIIDPKALEPVDKYLHLVFAPPKR